MVFIYLKDKNVRLSTIHKIGINIKDDGRYYKLLLTKSL